MSARSQFRETSREIYPVWMHTRQKPLDCRHCCQEPSATSAILLSADIAGTVAETRASATAVGPKENQDAGATLLWGCPPSWPRFDHHQPPHIDLQSPQSFSLFISLTVF